MKNGLYIKVMAVSLLLISSLAKASGPWDWPGLDKSKVLSSFSSPKENFKRLKNDGVLVTKEDLVILWPFRYFEGVDSKVLQSYAKRLGVTLDDSLEARNRAWRVYFASKNSYVNSLEVSMVVGSILGVFGSSFLIPSKVPEGCKIVYAVFSRVMCGGEAGPPCPSDELATSLPRELVFTDTDLALGIGLSYGINVTFSMIYKVLRERDNVKLHPFSSIREFQKHLKAQDIAYKDRQEERMAIYFFITTLSAFNVEMLLRKLTGTFAESFRTISSSDYAKRVLTSNCSQLIDRFTALPCNLTLPANFLQNVDYYTAGTYVFQATLIDLLPYLIPVGFGLLRYSLYVMNWF